MRYRLFGLLMAAMLALGIGGCGAEGTTADPLGTDSLTFGDNLTSANVAPRMTQPLKVLVQNASGKPVIGREVYFEFISNVSGATLSVPRAYTDSAGEVRITYMAGPTAGIDIVRAHLSNQDVGMTVTLIVGGGTGSYQLALAADRTSLAAGQTAILTATVTDGKGNPAVGVTVTFAISVNNTGATVSPLNGGRTNTAGIAQAYYTPGDRPGGSYQDTVTAGVAGAGSAIVITRTSITGTAYTITVTASPSLIQALEGQSVVEAKVEKVELGSSGSSTTIPVGDVTVNFSVITGGTGLGSVSPGSAITDGGGKAVTTYRGGAVAPLGNYSDTVQAGFTIGGITYSSAVVILYAP